MWKSRSSAVSMVACLITAALGASGTLAISQSGEQKDMRRVGHTDLQGRPAYHPAGRSPGTCGWIASGLRQPGPEYGTSPPDALDR